MEEKEISASEKKTESLIKKMGNFIKKSYKETRELVKKNYKDWVKKASTELQENEKMLDKVKQEWLKSTIKMTGKLAEELSKELEKSSDESAIASRKTLAHWSRKFTSLSKAAIKEFKIDPDWLKASLNLFGTISEGLAKQLDLKAGRSQETTKKSFTEWRNKLVSLSQESLKEFESMIKEEDKAWLTASVTLLDKTNSALTKVMDTKGKKAYKDLIEDRFKKSSAEITSKYQKMKDELKDDTGVDKSNNLEISQERELSALKKFYDGNLTLYAEMQRQQLDQKIDTAQQELAIAQQAKGDVAMIKNQILALEEKRRGLELSGADEQSKRLNEIDIELATARLDNAIKTDSSIATLKNELAALMAEDRELELMAVEDSARKQFKVKLDHHKKDLALLKESAKAKKENEKEDAAISEKKKKIADLRSAELERITTGIKKNFNIGVEVAEASWGLSKALSEKEIAKLESEVGEKKNLAQEEFDAGKLKLDEKLASDATFQEEYDNQLITLEATKANRLAEIDKELSDKKAALAKKDFDRKKAVDYATAVVGTAVAIVNALATQPFFPMGLIAAATAGAAGATQLAAIAATTPPKAARGGLIQGLSHAAGGTLIEAERGEAIINRRSTGIFAPLLSAINEAGGGVPFSAPFSDGGFTQREYQRQSPNSGITTEGIALAMSQAVAKQPIFVAVEDINTADRKYASVQDTSQTF